MVAIWLYIAIPVYITIFRLRGSLISSTSGGGMWDYEASIYHTTMNVIMPDPSSPALASRLTE